ncbi:MAG: hypothetical protein LUG21_05820 [Clostridiales bacterium]|nr:hypothetical protein [Clostridiales bacterium]
MQKLTIQDLDFFSYRSNLGLSLKRNLHHFDKDKAMQEIKQLRNWYITNTYIENLGIDYRIKSFSSAKRKYERYPNASCSRVFNDILEFRIICDSYDDVLKLSAEKGIRVVDMTQGKHNDDGYRAIHVYYQKDNFHYPIEIQYNTQYDRIFNDWLHENFYKRGYDNSVGQLLRDEYEKGKTEAELQEVLNHVVSNS